MLYTSWRWSRIVFLTGKLGSGGESKCTLFKWTISFKRCCRSLKRFILHARRESYSLRKSRVPAELHSWVKKLTELDFWVWIRVLVSSGLKSTRHLHFVFARRRERLDGGPIGCLSCINFKRNSIHLKFWFSFPNMKKTQLVLHPLEWTAVLFLLNPPFPLSRTDREKWAPGSSDMKSSH